MDDLAAGRYHRDMSAGSDDRFASLLAEFVDAYERAGNAVETTASDEEIVKVLGGNALRALAAIWPA